jgi:hypothetical protein
VLSLLLIAAENAAAVPEAEPPAFAAEWLAKRQAREEKKVEKAKADAEKPVDDKAKKKRADDREAKVRDGAARLTLWMEDLVRNGLAGIESKPPTFWEEQAKRLVDAQASTLASRVGRLAAIPGSQRDWPIVLVEELGKLRLLLHAYERIDALPAELASDVRQAIGWNVAQAELDANADVLADDWAIVGQRLDDDDRVTAQISWAVGRTSRRLATILQFSVGRQPFPEVVVPGVEQRGTLAFYPGAAKLRGKFVAREGTAKPIAERLPGADSLDEWLAAAAERFARWPWQTSTAGVLRDATIVVDADGWTVRDRHGRGLRAVGEPPWKLASAAGGRLGDVAFEWDGRRVRPLGLWQAGRYWTP